jgi:hypothetical protein
MLVRGVVDFARSCQAKQVSCDAALGEVAKQCGFEYSEAAGCFVLKLGE